MKAIVRYTQTFQDCMSQWRDHFAGNITNNEMESIYYCNTIITAQYFDTKDYNLSTPAFNRDHYRRDNFLFKVFAGIFIRSYDFMDCISDCNSSSVYELRNTTCVNNCVTNIDNKLKEDLNEQTKDFIKTFDETSYFPFALLGLPIFFVGITIGYFIKKYIKPTSYSRISNTNNHDFIATSAVDVMIENEREEIESIYTLWNNHN